MKTNSNTKIKENYSFIEQKPKNMKLIAHRNRLSVMPVTKEDFEEIEKMGNNK